MVNGVIEARLRTWRASTVGFLPDATCRASAGLDRQSPNLRQTDWAKGDLAELDQRFWQGTVETRIMRHAQATESPYGLRSMQPSRTSRAVLGERAVAEVLYPVPASTA